MDEITDFKTVECAEFWKKNESNIENIISILLFLESEEGFPNKEYEKGFKNGIRVLPTFYNQCVNFVDRELKNIEIQNEKEEQQKKIEKEKQRIFGKII